MLLPIFLSITIITPKVFSATLSEKECTYVDLRNETLGRSRDQGKSSWCYAFTAADMLNHAQHITKRISASDVALNYDESAIGRVMRWLDLKIINPKISSESVKLPHQTGFNKVALNKALKDGYCPESIFPSEQWIKVSPSASGAIEEVVPMISAMKDIYALHENRKNITSAEALPYYFKFKNIDANEFLKILQTKQISTFYQELRNTSCKDDRQAFSIDLEAKMVIKNSGIFKQIKNQMNQGHLVAIDYDARILKDHTHKGIKISEFHTSNLVARRWNANENRCEFLIRNSHGTNCNIYDPIYDCELGQVWLSEEQIYGSMSSIVYLDKI